MSMGIFNGGRNSSFNVEVDNVDWELAPIEQQESFGEFTSIRGLSKKKSLPRGCHPFRNTTLCRLHNLLT